MIKLRRQFTALSQGSIQWLSLSSNSLSYARFYQKQIIVTLLAKDPTDDSVRIPLWKLGKLQGKAKSLSNDKEYTFENGELEIPGKSIIFEI